MSWFAIEVGLSCCFSCLLVCVDVCLCFEDCLRIWFGCVGGFVVF